ncbi:type II toxin-antitoxin system RelE/ParE family toxin [Mucilaginibacter terrigena]|uniref:Type II toxin-antitoxin system RelE/ParE family toxin n=1 Tax=Mucilaginibacter terrigena TaxID=2492395 RepID=A0A4Q5LHN6_9SPHI|nr:type II toxin-antitoxin system RelE/ParE family toxin [Mucilaginibacter terrigena]RYU86888.1 type II toxin-antitoxin system RelE/ParE family toxin [Mucilaginibacter terrigena]
MGLTIIYSHIARRDMRAIYNFIRRDSLFYAQKEVKDIRTAVKKLKLNSQLGRKFEEFDDELTRELIFKNYRIIYDIVPDKHIIILSIHHHSRSLSNNPAFTSED